MYGHAVLEAHTKKNTVPYSENISHARIADAERRVLKIKSRAAYRSERVTLRARSTLPVANVAVLFQPFQAHEVVASAAVKVFLRA